MYLSIFADSMPGLEVLCSLVPGRRVGENLALESMLSKCLGQNFTLTFTESLKSIRNNSKCLFSTYYILETVPRALSVLTSFISQQS